MTDAARGAGSVITTKASWDVHDFMNATCVEGGDLESPGDSGDRSYRLVGHR